jgi:tetratricopeptide (TPR) repeat protein
MDIAAELQRGLALHQQGHLLEAGETYRQILAVDPQHVDALNLMGVVMQAAGDLEMAEDLLTRATKLAPDYFAPFANLGNALQAMGRLSEAIDAFHTALDLNADSVETVNNLASALNQTKQFEAALEASEQALKLLAAFPEALVNKGNALLGLGRPDEAIATYQKALVLAPGHGNALFNLANAFVDLEDFEAAIDPYRQSLAHDTGNPEKHFNLANALLKAGRLEDCLKPFEEALTLKPDYVDALCNHASALQSLGRTEEAISRLQKAMAFQPDSPDLHWNLSLAALQHGDYATGWAEYEWRWKMPTFADFDRHFTQPRWQGEPLDGRTLLIHTEQGFGDNIQFCRYVSKIAKSGGRVVLECRAELKHLFESLEGADECIALGDALPEFDCHAPLMSLPHIFCTTLDTVPTAVPYLSAPADTVGDSRIAEAEGFKVGLVWAGSPTRVDNHKRSLAFSGLAPLFDVPGVAFFSLQVGPESEQFVATAEHWLATDLSDNLNDFADTATAVAELDLIISVDTAVLHLAGALGKPAWGLMSRPTGFLWMDEGTHSVWYPTLRLFRQPARGDWQTVMSEVAAALAQARDKALQG